MTNFEFRNIQWLSGLWFVLLVASSGCSTGLFKPVQPWHNADAAAQSQRAHEALAKHESTLGSNNRNDGNVDVNSEQTNVAPKMAEVQTQRNSHANYVRPVTNQTTPSTGEAGKSERRITWEAVKVTKQDSPPIGPRITNQSTAGPATTTPSFDVTEVNVNTNNKRPITASRESQQLVEQYVESARSGYVQPNYLPRNLGSPEQFRTGSPSNLAAPIEQPETKTENSAKTPLYFGNEPRAPQRSKTFYRSQSPQETVRIPSSTSDGSFVQQTQFPETQQGAPSTFLIPTIDTGSPNELNPIIPPNAPSGSVTFPQNYADLDIYLSETSTGRINFGGAYNSDSGIVGQFVIDERNFDIFRLPRNFREIVDGTAWRGGGQNFRLELVPGSDVERYLVSFSEPFLLGSRVSLSSSLYYFQRQFFDYDEERLGGRFALGYRLTPDLSVSTGLRLENVEISDPRNATSPTLNATLGDTDLYIGNVSLIRDTRDHPFLPTEGNFVSLTYSQGFGEFDYSRGDIDFRTYRLMYQRPDGSGRHTLSYGTRVGFTGAQTPLFENYYAGGFSTLRGFDFRGASPLEGDIRVGGEFQWLNTIEYTFPITADDMVKGVLFTDFGTVEENIEIDSDNFRVAPGFGFRIHLPAAGIGAPLAFDFAFPVADAAGDDQEVFSFYLGVSR